MSVHTSTRTKPRLKVELEKYTSNHEIQVAWDNWEIVLKSADD